MWNDAQISENSRWTGIRDVLGLLCIHNYMDDTVTKSSNSLKNFDLTVDEIKLERAIKDLQVAIERIQQSTPGSDRLAFFESQIAKLEDQLDELREHTLIQLG